MTNQKHEINALLTRLVIVLSNAKSRISWDSDALDRKSVHETSEIEHALSLIAKFREKITLDLADQSLSKNAILRLNQCAESDDQKIAHTEADEVLTDLLTALGYSDVVEAWEKVPKWYA